MRVRHFGSIISLLLLVSLVLVACSPQTTSPTPATQKPAATGTPVAASPSWPKTITITTPSTGTGLNIYGGAIATMIERYTKVVAVVQPTTSGEESAAAFGRGDSEMSGAGGLSFRALYQGKGADLVRGLSGAYFAVYQIGVRSDSNIRTIADLKGKRCMFSRPGQPDYELIWPAVLKAYGMTEKDIVLMPALTQKDAAQALIEKTADAFLQCASMPQVTFLELDRSVGLRLLPIDPDKIKAIQKELSWPGSITVPAGLYKGTTVDTPALLIRSWFTAKKSLPDDFMYAVAKAMIEHISELKAAHAQFKDWTPQDLLADSVVPFHAGAFKYYKEAGLVTPELQQRQNDILKQMNQVN